VFDRFLREHGREPAAEVALPEAVNAMIQAGRAQVDVIETPGPWFGMTHREDRPAVLAGLQALTREGIYPEPLW
jgi:hypothetical protein